MESLSFRVNSTAESAVFWAERASAYREELVFSYHAERINMVRSLMRDCDEGNLLDFGMGDGLFLKSVVDRGGSGVGVDLDPSMVAAAEISLQSCPSVSLEVGGVEVLSKLPTGRFNAVLAANVLAYMPESQCEIFYRECKRLLKPGGALVVTHSNELFDMFTLNSYTVRFYSTHFNSDVSSLLTYPDLPDRAPFVTRENPLAYAHKLLWFGFSEIQQEFAIPHRIPPLLDSEHNPDDMAGRSIESALNWEEASAWKRPFLCSIFGSRSISVD